MRCLSRLILLIIAVCITFEVVKAYATPLSLQILPTASPIIYIQVLLGGLLVGGIYIVAALGLTLVFGVMRIINIVQGDFIILGAFVSFWLYALYKIDPFLSIMVSMPLFFAFGLPIQKYLMNPALRKGIDQPLIIAFGLSYIMQFTMLSAWTSNPKSVSTSFSGVTFTIGEVPVSLLRFSILIASILVLFLLHLFLTRTYLGMAIRANSQQMEAASLMGIDINRVNLFSYGLSLALAGTAGAFVSLAFAFDPSSGFVYLLKAFAVVIFGGVGSLSGALFGGLVLGMAESIGSFILGSGYRDAIAYVIFFIILLLRPTGILKRGKLLGFD